MPIAGYSKNRTGVNSGQNSCWICEGWHQMSFTYDTNSASPNFPKDPIFIHLEYEKFKGQYL